MGEEGTATELEPGTYSLLRSFSHKLSVPVANPSSPIALCTISTTVFKRFHLLTKNLHKHDGCMYTPLCVAMHVPLFHQLHAWLKLALHSSVCSMTTPPPSLVSRSLPTILLQLLLHKNSSVLTPILLSRSEEVGNMATKKVGVGIQTIFHGGGAVT